MRVYAGRNVFKSDGSKTIQLLHTFLFPEAIQVDHKDGNGLNNTRENLRAATAAQNGMSFRRKSSGKTSKYRGVKRFRSGKWVAQIHVGGKGLHLGYFENEEDAARAYDSAAVKHWGEWASPNLP